MNINYQNIDLYIQDNYSLNSVEVWMIEKTIEGNFSIHYDGKKLIKTFIDPSIVKSKEVKPLFSLPMTFANFLFKELAESNAKKGIKTKDQNSIEGQLEATKVHLEDMRKFSEKLLNHITIQK